MSRPTLQRYGREIERLWSARFDRALLLSPRDWTAIERWHERGIPLAVIADAIEDVATRRRRGAPPRGLTYLERSVTELWELVRAGRHGPSEELAGPSSGQSPLDAWEAAAARADAPLGPWLAELAARARGGEAAAAVEAELVDALWGHCDPALRAGIDAEIEAQLGEHRRRMADEIWQRTLASNRLRRARQELGLPSLLRNF